MRISPEQSAALAAAGEAGLRAAGWLRDLVGRGEPRCLLDLAGDIAQALTGLDPYDHDTPDRDGRGGMVPELRERLVDPWWILHGDLPLTHGLRAALLALCGAACTAPVLVANGLDEAGLRAVCEVIDHTVGADPGPAEPAGIHGRLKILWVPTRRQTMCCVPRIRSVPYDQVARPPPDHVSS
ncbi:hypothetical protein ACFXOY_28195 [Streptomyces niveus]|uniref:hypothetical protein n=1 Tax=Streptomyces niveus TaxID=193462 RepID=UPI00368198DD